MAVKVRQRDGCDFLTATSWQCLEVKTSIKCRSQFVPKLNFFYGSIPWWRYFCNFIRPGWDGLDLVSASKTLYNLLLLFFTSMRKCVYFYWCHFCSSILRPARLSSVWQVHFYLLSDGLKTCPGHWVIERVTNHVASFGLSYRSWQHRSLPHVYRMFVMRQKGSGPSVQAYPRPPVLLSFLRFTRLLWLRWWMEAFVAHNILRITSYCSFGGEIYSFILWF